MPFRQAAPPHSSMLFRQAAPPQSSMLFRQAKACSTHVCGSVDSRLQAANATSEEDIMQQPAKQLVPCNMRWQAATGV